MGILALNSDRDVETYMAVPWADAVINPCNTRWSATEIAYSLDDCDTRVLLVDDPFVPMVAELRAKSRSLATLIHVGDGPTPEGMLSYEALIGARPSAKRAEAAVIGMPDKQWGEVGVAVLVLKPGQLLDRDRVVGYRGHRGQRLARFKCPAAIVSIEALPRNATGKVISVNCASGPSAAMRRPSVEPAESHVAPLCLRRPR